MRSKNTKMRKSRNIVNCHDDEEINKNKDEEINKHCELS